MISQNQIIIVFGDVSLTKINYLIQDGLFKGLEEIVEEKIIDIKELVFKTSIHHKKEFDSLDDGARPSIVKIKLNKDFRGGVLEHTTIFSKGHRRNPVNPVEVIDKFKKLNPNYDINRLHSIDNMESSPMKEVIDKLIDFD